MNIRIIALALLTIPSHWVGQVEAHASTIEIITRVNDHWQQTHSPEVRSFWDEAAYHTGNMEAYRLLGLARWHAYSDAWARHNRWMGAREQDPAKWKYKNYGEGQDYVLFGDWQICFQTYLDLYELTPDRYKIERAIEVMDHEVRRPENDFWWWADALYMVMPVLTKFYKATGEVKYLDKLYSNFCYADSLMFDPVAHLYFRDGRYVYPQHKTDLGKRDFWARGDGWVLAGLAKVLTDMPADYAHRPLFELRFKQLAEAVAACQQPEGYWSRSMLDPEQAEGPETSGTAFFTYGMLWGMNHGLLKREVFAPVVDKAWTYLITKALQPDGSVGFVQPIGDRAIKGQQLSEANVANFGVGAFLLAACEHLRYEDGSVETDDQYQATVIIKNNEKEFRQQVVEVDADEVFRRLGIQGGRQFQVFDAAGLEVPYQLSYDGHILLDAGVRPNGQLELTFRKGMPRNYPFVCYGRIVPERKDDFAWENDRGAYRVYGPALQKTGERSYGLDVWSKNTPELVIDYRYHVEDINIPRAQELRKTNRKAGDLLYRESSYHNDHGRGMDLYKVGATLGCGTPALMVGGEIVYPYCYKTHEVLDMGPMRVSVLLDYNTTAVGTDSVTEHRLIQLDKGSNFNRMTVSYDGLSKPVQLASGVVLHSEDKESVELGHNYVVYADPTDNVAVNNCQLFVATLYPDGINATKVKRFDQPRDGNEGHALGIVDNYKGQPYSYLFGSAWSKYDVRTMAEWRERVGWTLRSVQHPLQIALK